jgi:hypothetical protein
VKLACTARSGVTPWIWCECSSCRERWRAAEKTLNQAHGNALIRGDAAAADRIEKMLGDLYDPNPLWIEWEQAVDEITRETGSFCLPGAGEAAG